MRRLKLELPKRTALLYLLFGALWILLSDRVLYLFDLSSAQLTVYQTLKGWFFVLVSSILIYLLLLGELAGRKRAEQELRNSQAQTTGILDSAMDAIITTDASQHILMFNPAAETMFRCSHAEALGQPLEQLIPQRFRSRHNEHMQKYAQTGTTNRAMGQLGTIYALRRDGEEFPVEASISQSRVAGTHLFTVILRDVTRRKQEERQTLQLKRLYATLSQVNETIVRVKNQEELFNSICRVAVVFGEFRLAWIGLYDRETGQVTPIAKSSAGQNSLPFHTMNVNELPFREGLIGLSVRTGSPQFSSDLQADARMSHWSEIAAREGYRSVAAVPLCRGEEVIGFLNLYSSEVGFFTVKAEQDLLEEMGLDISFALEVLEKEAERKRTEEALHENEERLRLSLQAANQGLYDLNVQTGDAIVNQEYAQMLGYDPETFVETNAAWIERLHPDDRESVAKTYRDYIDGVLPDYRVEFRQRMKDGGWKWILSLGKVIEYDPDGKPLRMLGTHTDITERKTVEYEIESRSRQLATLLETSQSLTESLNLADVLQKITDQSTVLLGIETAAIYLADGEQICLGACTPPLPPDFPEMLRCANLADHPHIARALDSGELVFLPNTAGATLTTAEQTVVNFLGLRTIVYIPLAAKQNARGALILGTRGKPRDFSQHESDLARTFSNQAALAIANARLYEDLARYTGELENQISEREQAQAALSNSEERFRLLFENNHTVMMLIEPHSGRIKHANQAAAAFYGYPLPELCSMSINQINQMSPEEVYAERMTALQEEKDYFNFRHRLVSGRIRSVEVHSAPVDVDGETLLFSIVYDVTERRQAEESLKRHINFLTGLREVDQAIASSFDLRLSLNILVSRAIQLLKVDATTILLLDPVMNILEYGAGHGFRTNIPYPASIRLGESFAGRAVMERRMVQIPNLNHGLNDFFSIGFLREDKFVSYCGVPLIIKGKVVGVMEVFDRKPVEREQEWFDFLGSLAGQAAIAIDNARLWDQIQRHTRDLELRVAERTAALNRTNAELEHANRAKDEFLANMSHELRTPLNSILGLSESLLEQRRDPLTEYQQRSLEIIASSGNHLLELINDVLDLAKIEAGKFDHYPQMVDVDALCRSSLSFVKSQAVRKLITIQYRSEASPLRVSVDPRRMKQILVNLLTNAVKFTPEGGQVALQVHVDAREGRLRFSVTDTGIGIAAQDLENLFQPFVQVDSKLNRQFEGTGLGLALVQKLTDLHGGSVEVDSEVGVGSRFTINLPWKETGAALQEESDLEGEHAAGGLERSLALPEKGPDRATVLLAEDNMVNVLTISEYLESHGYRVVKAHDGMEAIEKAESSDPRTILMDIQMPVMDGLEAIRQLRLRPRFADTPIIAITALAMPGDRERCLEAGANEYLSKPVRLKKLLQTIQSLTGQRQ